MGSWAGLGGGARRPSGWLDIAGWSCRIDLHLSRAARRGHLAKGRGSGEEGRGGGGRAGAILRIAVGAVLARWGGMGSHRYQVGFSGDVSTLSWENLAYQPYFSATAANVGYGYWSHDVEGPSADLELYTRWVQWGALSGVMRMHERGMSGGRYVVRLV